MSFYLLACKEIDGSIYVCRLPKSTNATTPGVPSQWYYVGSGKSPKVQSYGGTEFLLIFNYLSHLSARVLDIATWPPTQVDPIQPESPITIQQPEDTLLFNPSSYTNSGTILEYPMPPQIQATPVAIDSSTNQYSTTITTLSSYYPGTDLHWYRVYRQPIGGGAWTLVMDWQPQTLNYTDTETGSLRFNYRATLGLSFNRSTPNDPSQHFEGTPGNTVVVDSEVPPFYYAPSTLEIYDVSLNNAQKLAFSGFGTRQISYVEDFSEILELGINGITSTSKATMSVVPSVVVFSLTTPDLSFVNEVESVSIFSKAAYSGTSPRLDQP